MRILICEDEEDILNGLAKGLRKLNYYVDTAMDGEEALSLYFESKYDLVILDLNMPKLDGLEVLKAIREDDADSKVIILSARDTLNDKVLGLDLGANDYLVKPFAFGELEARIRNLLRREYTHGETSLVSGELRLDTASRQVFAKGSEVNLTKKETAILEYLMRHAGTVVSSEELLSHAWDSNVDPFSNSVRVHIFSVRKKLREVLGYDPISNKVGEGYYLKEDSDDKDE